MQRLRLLGSQLRDAMSDEETHLCPRRTEMPATFRLPDRDTWHTRVDTQHPGIINNGVRACSHCGSMHPDDFMAHCENGTAEIGPTDKSYKAYVRVPGNQSQGKFYFQHLSDEQKRHFVDLYNDHVFTVGYPGHFYQMPFFMGPRL